jgi:hypothetical protein
MIWKLFLVTGVPFGIAMALYHGWGHGASGAAVGLASGVPFGLVMAAVLGGMHKAAGNTRVNACRELDFAGPPGVALEAGQHALAELAARRIAASGNTLRASTRANLRSWGESLAMWPLDLKALHVSSSGVRLGCAQL